MIISTSEPPIELSRRLAAQLHLAICSDCRMFRRQIEALGALARGSSGGYEAEPRPDFEEQIVRALVRGEQDA